MSQLYYIQVFLNYKIIFGAVFRYTTPLIVRPLVEKYADTCGRTEICETVKAPPERLEKEV